MLLLKSIHIPAYPHANAPYILYAKGVIFSNADDGFKTYNDKVIGVIKQISLKSVLEMVNKYIIHSVNGRNPIIKPMDNNK